jgi:hypothetical protein
MAQTEASPSDFTADYYFLLEEEKEQDRTSNVSFLSPILPARDNETLLLLENCSERRKQQQRLFLEEEEGEDGDHTSNSHVLNNPSSSSLSLQRDPSSSINDHHHHHHSNAHSNVWYSSRRRAPLNGLNFLNVVTFLLHLFVSWGIGVWGLNGAIPTRWEIAQRFETLVTPTVWTYFMWYPILVLEGVFTVAQLLPYYRARPIVQGGTGYWFFYTFCIQTAWTLFYSFQLFVFSFIAVLAALLSLVKLLASQQASLEGISTRQRRLSEYYLFRFPFYLHTGWMAFVAAHHFSLLFRSYDAGVGLQVAIDIVSLGWLLPTALIFLACPHFKDFVIPLVIIWSYVRTILLLSLFVDWVIGNSTTMISYFSFSHLG